MPAKKDSLIEIKGAMLPVLSVILRSLDLAQIEMEARRMFGDEAFFDGDLAALDITPIDGNAPVPAVADWTALCRLFAGNGLRVVGIRGGSPELVASAGAAGLPPQAAPDPVPVTETSAPVEPIPAPPPPAAANTLIIDRPLRSGQQVYARGGDVVVLAIVNPGAEVIADGNIHVYAPLRGRALAGANGNTKARILTTRMEAELVSIAGLYRTFENGVPAELAGKPAQVRLTEDGNGGNPRLMVEPLSIG